MIIIAYLYIINKHRNSWLYNILGLAANGAPGTSPPTVSCNNSGKYRRDRRLGCPLPVGQIYIFWPNGQRDGQPVPYEAIPVVQIFRIFMQHHCCWHCRSINSFCNKHCHTVFCRCTFGYHFVFSSPIFIHFIYPHFCPHSIHTHVDNRGFIHRAAFLQATFFSCNFTLF